MHVQCAVVLGLLAAMTLGRSAMGQSHSELWGEKGELWTPASRLPEFSFAGYHFGEDPLPQVAVTANVKDFGAQGDGRTDDTEAFKRAIAETKKGAIFIPEGRYVLSDILWIEKPQLVLRGAGRDKTVLHFTRELEDVRPNMGATTGGRPTSNYSWSGGFLWVKGENPSTPISAIISEQRRGDRTLALENAAGLTVGQRVLVEQTDDADKSLLAHLYSNDSGDTAKIINRVKVRMVSRVASVAGNRVTLERPLRWDLRQSWQPALKTFAPTVAEVGIEDLSVSFPMKPYAGHFTERGMNGVAMTGVADCWLRNVRISNCDSGIFVGGTCCTVDGLTIDGDRPTNGGDAGHHGVALGQDCLLQNFDIQTKFIHDISLESLHAGNVFKNGKGINLALDHHKRAPHENLFCNLDVGDGGQIWRSGGGGQLGKHCAARGTFWCIRSRRDVAWPPAGFGPDSMNLVGVKTRAGSIKDPDGKWLEAIPPEELQPADLHAAQLAKRLESGARVFTPEQLALPGKRGACWTLRDPIQSQAGTWEQNLPKLAKLQPYWNYSWGPDWWPQQTNCVTSEFVPMIWGRPRSAEALRATLQEKVVPRIKDRTVKRVLGFNEPDKQEQANMPYMDAIELWPEFMKLGVPLCSPACANPVGINDESAQGVPGTWMRDFMREVDRRGYRVDYIGAHWYGGTSAESFKQRMRQTHEMYGRRPLLITEFAPADWNVGGDIRKNRHTPAAVLKFMKEVLPWMEEQAWIAGYSWFSFDVSSPCGTSSALLDEAGNLTACGRYYRSVTRENRRGDQAIEPDPVRK